MKCLVTGGSGFIGSWLCEALLAVGNEVVCMDNLFTSTKANVAHLLDCRGFEFMRHDVCDPWHVECDRIYHLACPASPVHYQRNPVRTIKTAVLGTMNALGCARDTGARLLITSTSEVYGDPMVHPQPETYFGNVNTLGPRANYDEGKRVGETLASSWTAQYGTDVRIARLFNCYGPRLASGDGRLIPNLVNQAMRGEDLTVYGTGEQTRSLCYVDDTVAGLMLMMEVDLSRLMVPRRPPYEHMSAVMPVNIGNPDERTILSIAEGVRALFPGCPGIVHRPLPEDDPTRRCPDISRARKVLGWGPRVDYASGIRATVEWFRAQSGAQSASSSPPRENPFYAGILRALSI